MDMSSPIEAPGSRRADEITAFLVRRISDLIQRPPTEIDVDAPHSEYGLDSASVVVLTADLEDWLGIELPESLGWDHPNVRAIAEHVAALPIGGSR